MPTADGRALSAWYVPSRNGAALLVDHGSGGSRERVVAHVRMLARHGYGVLALDLPGNGESEGHSNGLGDNAQPAIDAGLDYLSQPAGRRSGPHRRLRALARRRGADPGRRARSPAADGRRRWRRPAPGRPGRERPSRRWRALVGDLQIAVVRGISGMRSSPSLNPLIGRIAPRPVLLVASGAPQEIPTNRVYAEHGGPTTELLELPTAAHTGGLRKLGARVRAAHDRVPRPRAGPLTRPTRLTALPRSPRARPCNIAPIADAAAAVLFESAGWHGSPSQSSRSRCSAPPRPPPGSRPNTAALQVALRANALYAGSVDGVLGPGTRPGDRPLPAAARAGRPTASPARGRGARWAAAGARRSARRPAAHRPARLRRRRAAVAAGPPRLPLGADRRRARLPHLRGRCGASRPRSGSAPTASPAPRPSRRCGGPSPAPCCASSRRSASRPPTASAPAATAWPTRAWTTRPPTGTPVGAAGRGCVQLGGLRRRLRQPRDRPPPARDDELVRATSLVAWPCAPGSASWRATQIGPGRLDRPRRPVPTSTSSCACATRR